MRQVKYGGSRDGFPYFGYSVGPCAFGRVKSGVTSLAAPGGWQHAPTRVSGLQSMASTTIKGQSRYNSSGVSAFRPLTNTVGERPSGDVLVVSTHRFSTPSDMVPGFRPQAIIENNKVPEFRPQANVTESTFFRPPL